MAVYMPRSAWTSVPASGDRLTGSVLKGVAVHWPGTRTSRFGTESTEAVARRIRHYRDFHVDVKGWRDLGYNLVIDQAGRVWEGRTTDFKGDLVGAHCASPANPDANHEYVGVLLLLGADEDPTGAMVEAFQDWRHTRFLRGWPLRTDLREHSKVPGAQTACAGPQVRALLATGALHQPPEDDMPTAKEIADEILDVILPKVDETSGSGPRMRVRNFLRWIHEHSAKSRGSIEQTIIPQIAAIRSEQAASREQLVQLAAQQSGVQLSDEQVQQLAQRIAEAGQGACDQVLERLSAAGAALDGPDA